MLLMHVPVRDYLVFTPQDINRIYCGFIGLVFLMRILYAGMPSRKSLELAFANNSPMLV